MTLVAEAAAPFVLPLFLMTACAKNVIVHSSQLEACFGLVIELPWNPVILGMT